MEETSMLAREHERLTSSIGGSSNVDEEVDNYRELEEDIERKETLVRKLQRKKNLEEVVEILEKVLISKLQLHGPDAEQVFDTCEQLTLAYNTFAMKLIDAEDFESAHELLKKAEVLTDQESELSRTRESISRLRAVTFNNLGCLYKHRKNFYTAIKYLEKALGIEESTSYAENPASTHLNLCATLSKCGRHDKALAYAKAALKILNKQASLKSTSTLEDFKDRFSGGDPQPKLLTTLAIAYYNAATQHEYLNHFEEAHHCYKQSKAIGGLCWGSNDHMLTSLRQSSAAFREKYLRHKKSQPPGSPGKKEGGRMARRRPTSAGPRLGSTRDVTQSSRLLHRKQKPVPNKFGSVPPDTVRIYSGGDHILFPLNNGAMSRPSSARSSPVKKATQMVRPSSARPSTSRKPAKPVTMKSSAVDPESPKLKQERTTKPKPPRTRPASAGARSRSTTSSSSVQSSFVTVNSGQKEANPKPPRPRPASARASSSSSCSAKSVLPGSESQATQRPRPASASTYAGRKEANAVYNKENIGVSSPSPSKKPPTRSNSMVGRSFLKRYSIFKFRQESMERRGFEALTGSLSPILSPPMSPR